MWPDAEVFGSIRNSFEGKLLIELTSPKLWPRSGVVLGLQHLLILASSTICNLIGYKAAILNIVFDTVYKHLEEFQTSALPLTLYLPMWNPNILLRKHAVVPPPIFDQCQRFSLSFLG